MAERTPPTKRHVRKETAKGVSIPQLGNDSYRAKHRVVEEGPQLPAKTQKEKIKSDKVTIAGMPSGPGVVTNLPTIGEDIVHLEMLKDFSRVGGTRPLAKKIASATGFDPKDPLYPGSQQLLTAQKVVEKIREKRNGK